jgi:hypothetical protein
VAERVVIWVPAGINGTGNKEGDMETKSRIAFLWLTLVACIGVLFAPISSADERPLSLSYAGFGYYTSVDPNADGVPVGLTLVDGKGTLGSANAAITAEWYISPRVCREGYDVPFALVSTAVVYTFSDHSQFFGFSQNGWLCLSSTTGAYYGEETGVYNGGTRRFEGATGEWATKFDGVILEPATGFRSIRGTVTGTLVTP